MMVTSLTDWEDQGPGNKVIKGTIEQDLNYFQQRIDTVLKHTCYVTGNKYEEAFMKLIIDDPMDDKPLKYVEQYIVKNRTEGNILEDISNCFKELILNLLEKSVESENWDSLNAILTWFEFNVLDHKDMHRLTLLWKANQTYDNVKCHIKWNNTAMIRACEKNNYEMVLSFLQFGYFIDCKELKQSNFETKNVCDLFCRNFKKSGDDMLFHFRKLHAVCKPTYQIAKFRNKIDQEYEKWEDYNPDTLLMEYHSSVENEDPITQAFRNVSKAQLLIINNVEYAQKLEQIECENKKFVVEMLDLCKTTEEADMILSIDLNQKSTSTICYPRLEAAISTANTEFVSHDFCQQALQKRWLTSDLTGNILPWNSASRVDKLFYVVSCVVLMPVHFLTKSLQDVYFHFRTEVNPIDVEDQRKNSQSSCFESFFSFPFHRFMAHATSSLFFLAIMIAQALKPDKSSSIIEWCFPIIILFYAVSYLVHDLTRIKGMCNIYNPFDEIGFWSIYNIIHDLLLITGSCLKMFHLYSGGEQLLEPETCLNAVALTMAILKLVYWCQLSSWLGPLAISIRRCFKDIFMVLTTYIILYVGFTLGIHYVMSVPLPLAEKICPGNDTETKNAFSFLFRGNRTGEVAWKASLWAFFDPGHPEYLGCYDGFARSTGLTLWGMYQVVNVIMLLPLMVALMSNTMSMIDTNKDQQWKFQRTEIWLRFLNFTELPAPLNIFDSILNLFCRKIAGQRKKKTKGSERMK